MKTPLCIAAALGVACSFSFAAGPAIPPAFGPHTKLSPSAFEGVPSFTATQRIAGTYYFYWYDAATKEHIIDHDNTDALTDHPANMADFSYRSVSWHERELKDMIAAGIDVVLPVFWGAPSEQSAKAGLHWSYVGIPKLVEARENLLRAGKNPPRIGLFYDTSTLQYNQWGQHVDLTTEYGRQWFYATVRDFFSMVPPKHWAMIDAKPIVLLYAVNFAKKHDQTVIDHTKEEFRKDFGGRVPWIAREVSWQVKADSTVAWGGALGVKNPGVASIGPGYDHSAVPGRTPLVVDRQGGKFYKENWIKLLRRPSHFVVVETWNEFHEGTDVAESREFGRQYIELTRKYTDLFKQGWKPEWPKGKYTGVKEVSVQLGATNRAEGLVQLENEDGITVAANADGRNGRRVTSRGPKYMYFSIDESFKKPDPAEFVLSVDYFDGSSGTISVEYDGSDESAPFNGAYSPSPDVARLTGAKQWKTAAFKLREARLLNSQNRGADFRLVISSTDVVVGGIAVRRALPNPQGP
jgi:hypothetical protein